MGKIPFGKDACCLPNLDGVTYLQIGPRGHVVGMMGLEKVFEQLWAMGRRPEEASDAELVGMARQFNYVPNRESVETDYATALRRSYTAFYARQIKET